MLALLANKQQGLECNICHGRFEPNEHNHVAITSDIHVCVGCQPFQTQPVEFFTWYLMLEQVCQQRGLNEIPRSSPYPEDWPIDYYDQGLAPEDAIAQIELAVA